MKQPQQGCLGSYRAAGEKIKQPKITKIPQDEKFLKSVYERSGGLCTAFTLKIIMNSRRNLDEFTAEYNNQHRLAWDEDRLLNKIYFILLSKIRCFALALPLATGGTSIAENSSLVGDRYWEAMGNIM
ncbi:hypothetical protein F5884DRAFT_745594 [Xylogone sp. PMI_703]|nr:hypothetical protein F5884DRAFT_745594 [Xylogone sp. PMI_703]